MASSPFATRKFLIAFAIAWLVLIFDHAAVIWSFDFSAATAVTDSLVSNLLLLAACLCVMNVIRYYSPNDRQYLNIFVMCLLLIVAWAFASKWILLWFLDDDPYYAEFLRQSFFIRGSIGLLVICIVTMIMITWFSWKEQQKIEERKSDTEKMTREAELFKLRQQLQPHFLFNSLNSINALIGSRPEEARKMVQQLSSFLRGTLKKEETQLVSLREELQHLQLYLDIEKVRFGNRLTTMIRTDPVLLELKVPALLLQPVVENAIKFGLYDTTGETLISINTRVQDHELIIQVTNPYDPETALPQQGTGFGLSSIQRRLYLLFGRNDLLHTSAKDNIFITTIKLPQAGNYKDA